MSDALEPLPATPRAARGRLPRGWMPLMSMSGYPVRLVAILSMLSMLPMLPMLALLGVVGSTLVGLSTAAADEASEEQPQKIGFAVPWLDAMGYTPLLVSAISNVDDRVAITATANGSRATSELILHAHQTLRTTLLLPPGASGMIAVSWRFASGTANHEEFNARRQHRGLDLAVVDGGDGVEVAAIAKLVAPLAHPGYGFSWSNDRISSFAASDLPDRWQAFPIWLSVLIEPGEDARLSNGQREALATWARAGGSLWVGEARQLTAWSGWATPHVLAGGSLASGAVDHRDELVQRLIEEISQNFEPMARPVPGTEKKPTFGFTVIALVFTVIAGPLNLWWVGRRGQRHLFLVTTPLISLATCLGLVIWSLAAEGIAVRRIASQVTVLDQGSQRAVTWARCTYYAGLSVSGLAVDDHAKVIPFDPPETRQAYGYRVEPLSDLAIDWRDGQHASGSWIPARVNRQLLFTSPRPERFRLLVVPAPGGGWVLTNGLGVGLSWCQWRAPDGGYWHCGPLAGGAHVALEAFATGTAAVSSSAAATSADPAREPTVIITDTSFARGFGVDVERACRFAVVANDGFIARLAAPFGSMPGPVSIDVAPIESWVCGIAPPAGTP